MTKTTGTYTHASHYEHRRAITNPSLDPHIGDPNCRAVASYDDAAPDIRNVDSAPAGRSAVDNQFILGLLWQERADVAIALLCALLCTVSNLAAPVISGYFIECLAGRQPMSLYPKVRRTTLRMQLTSSQAAAGFCPLPRAPRKCRHAPRLRHCAAHARRPAAPLRCRAPTPARTHRVADARDEWLRQQNAAAMQPDTPCPARSSSPSWRSCTPWNRCWGACTSAAASARSRASSPPSAPRFSACSSCSPSPSSTATAPASSPTSSPWTSTPSAPACLGANRRHLFGCERRHRRRHPCDHRSHACHGGVRCTGVVDAPVRARVCRLAACHRGGQRIPR